MPSLLQLRCSLAWGFVLLWLPQEVSGLRKVTKEVSCLDRAAGVDSSKKKKKKKVLNIDKPSLETQLSGRATTR